MEILSRFFQSNLTLIYFFYGLAFFVTGVVVALESGRASQLGLARALPFLAAFGIIHGGHEWAEMFQLIVPTAPHSSYLGDVFRLLLLVLSFLFLIAFAARLLVLLEPKQPRWLNHLAWIAAGLYAVLLLNISVFAAPVGSEGFIRLANIWARYLLGVPGALLALRAMWVQRRAFIQTGWAQFDHDLIGAMLAFGWYAITQMVVAPADFFPATVLNTATFLALVGMPVQLFRAIIVAGLAFFIIRVMRIFEVEYARQLEAANQARLSAQQDAARELSALFEVCRIIGTTLDLDVLLPSVITRIVELVEPMRVGQIYLFDSLEQRLVLRAHHARPHYALNPAEQELTQRAAWQAFQQARHTDAADPITVRLTTSLSLLLMPLRIKGAVNGILGLGYEGAFTNFPVIRLLSRQLALGTENACLYLDVQEKEILRGQLLGRVVSAQEEERKRIAREIHDDTGQMLTALAAGLSGVEVTVTTNPSLAKEQITALREMCTRAIEGLRRLVADLRPPHLDDLGLVATLRWYAKQQSEHFALPIEVQVTGSKRRLPSQFETIVFRIAQEALTNVIKHARATAVGILLAFDEATVTLQVKDNGIGFEPAQVLGAKAKRPAWGLMGIQERVSLVGGTSQIESVPGQGTTITVQIPVASFEGVDHVEDQTPAG